MYALNRKDTVSISIDRNDTEDKTEATIHVVASAKVMRWLREAWETWSRNVPAAVEALGPIMQSFVVSSSGKISPEQAEVDGLVSGIRSGVKLGGMVGRARAAKKRGKPAPAAKTPAKPRKQPTPKK